MHAQWKRRGHRVAAAASSLKPREREGTWGIHSWPTWREFVVHRTNGGVRGFREGGAGRWVAS
jgi:hypothetical protein